MATQKNKDRKSNLDLIGSMLQERAVKWSHRYEYDYFIFEIRNVEIHVSHNVIKIIKEKETISFLDNRFDEVLDQLKKPLNLTAG
ncbi:hypothetical protein PGH12_06890 [Chryseobacterium wangxinyae]|uniref:hypothetical protein n=1 Tax=Chryseobacterium sp. CY350 TaxID=2997336 RepID=UPI00226E11DF|nr:hypothetical protein [Chryseobacterium sp. CY350]MCY0976877.1 hypothetical protein [Chryseobacterium sp. CY350]WBZ96876.1 hypothetical protein PGH12_06890 [Chryseobacterium sp. CY350]